MESYHRVPSGSTVLLVKCDCGKTLSAPANESASKGKCPHCGRVISLSWSICPPSPRFGLQQAHPPLSLALSPDDRLLATVGGAERGAGNGRRYHGEATLWDLANGNLQLSLPGHRNSVCAVAFSPDSQWLVTAEQSDWVHVWNVSRGLYDVVMGLPEHAFRAHKGSISSIQFSPDGRWLASAGGQGEVRLWDTGSWRQEAVWATDRIGSSRLAFAPSGEYLAAAWRSAGPVVVWDLATRETTVELRLRQEEDAEDLALAFVGSGARLAVLGPKELRVWDISACQVIITLETPGMQCLAAAAQADLLVVAGWDATRQIPIRLFGGGGRELGHLGGHNLPVTSIALANDGAMLATAGRDSLTNVWELHPA